MKKNKMMRLASGLLVAVLLTTCAISGTFAKYTTQDSASDSARVAKWGVELQVVGDLYGINYKTTVNTKTNSDTGISVQSNADGKNVVAPGTKHDGNGFNFSLNGQPEVSVNVNAKISAENIYLKAGTYGVMVQIPEGVVTDENFATLGTIYTMADGVYTAATSYADTTTTTTYYTLEDYVHFSYDYYPVVYNLEGSTNNATGTCTADSLKSIAGTIASCITGTTETGTTSGATTTYDVSEVFAPNSFLADVVKLGNEKLTWEWNFDNDSCEKEGDDAGNFCKADTILGNLQAGDVFVVKYDEDTSTWAKPVAASDTNVNDYNLETSFSIDITVTQVD